MQEYDILIIGGGAAGFFAAINAAEMDPDASIAILERGKEVLGKVRISGGGRCNVTHAEFLPKELVRNYPRGEKELLGPFHSFMTGDTIDWFEKRGVPLKVEADGRMFPETNDSQTIIDLFLNEAKRLGIHLLTRQPVRDIIPGPPWEVSTGDGSFRAKKVMVATGSNPKMWKHLERLGHRVVPGVPSLFTFTISDPRIVGLPGIAVNARVGLIGTDLSCEGALLITHWGMSGPAILKLSAWGARELSNKKQFNISVNWIPEYSQETVKGLLQEIKLEKGRQEIQAASHFKLPKRLWQRLLAASGISEGERWADLNTVQIERLALELTCGRFSVRGKSTFKEEFVTAGGVELKEVDFRTFESKLCKNLYLAGEVLNIDAVTGGFNFQNAWTGGYIAARAMARPPRKIPVKKQKTRK